MIWRSGLSTTAPATTGPARQPRPTSSTPHTRQNPSLLSTFSSVRVAATRVMMGLAPSNLFLCVPHPRRLALQIAQEVKLGAAHFGGSHDFHFLNDWRVQRENALDALPERDLAHGK